MSAVVRKLLGYCLLALTLPVVGSCRLYGLYLALRHRPKGMSVTALSILMFRVALHIKGARIDEPSVKLVKSAGYPFVSYTAISTCYRILHFIERVGNISLSLDYPAVNCSKANNRVIVPLRMEFLRNALRDDLAHGSTNQIVVLGGGFDTTLTSEIVLDQLKKDPSLKTFEVDKSETQRLKIIGMKTAEINDSHITYVPCNFENENFIDKLVENGFDTSKKAFIQWEGVVYYLTNDAVNQTLQTISSRCAPGTTVNFDYPITNILSPTIKRILGALGEPQILKLESEPSHKSVQSVLSKLLEENGLKLTRHLILSNYCGGCATGQVH